MWALDHALCHAGIMSLAQWLLYHGAGPNDGECLYHAIELGRPNGLGMMQAAEANPRGTNALKGAMVNLDLVMVKMLLDAGVDPNKDDA
ncbi:hypothetical protein [Yoonia sediminilitoris]|uniref:Uncharacterized protein n=1 Tax=Yoonia sediminilitoris TaxID=1286148 RepID=A0A2T6K7G2_9RHOB|nr:hypothetical protein [Yoonia sediminilitoris]PUB10660.1 hypothetical protein C8N45_1173 [Yoonia sediminilitoris]RCW90412.1 hypothetical protein DFP92_1173 [Yoonia sediminilitoris]